MPATFYFIIKSFLFLVQIWLDLRIIHTRFKSALPRRKHHRTLFRSPSTPTPALRPDSLWIHPSIHPAEWPIICSGLEVSSPAISQHDRRRFVCHRLICHYHRAHFVSKSPSRVPSSKAVTETRKLQWLSSRSRISVITDLYSSFSLLCGTLSWQGSEGGALRGADHPSESWH